MPIDTVVVAVGTGDQNRLEEVTETAIDIAGPANATVRLIHVFEREEYDQIREQLDIDPDSGVTPDEVAKRHVAIRELGDVIDALEATGGSVRLERLTSSGGADTRSDPVVVDRGRLTERQREVVRTAQRLGYFEHPRGASATEVADAIGIARATFSEHLAAAQRRVFEDLVGG